MPSIPEIDAIHAEMKCFPTKRLMLFGQYQGKFPSDFLAFSIVFIAGLIHAFLRHFVELC